MASIEIASHLHPGAEICHGLCLLALITILNKSREDGMDVQSEFIHSDLILIGKRIDVLGMI